jgi:tetratricopeptide (TPR) repeat protein
MPSFVPQFYLANLQDTPELQGQHDLGPPVPMLSLTDIEARRTVRTEVSVRARTFAEFAIGLSLFASDKYGDARVHFLNAANNADWKPEAGKENVYLLLGYTSGKLGDLADARKNFEEARRLNPEFARAYLGLGEVAFQESLGAPEACARDHVNAAGIQSAIQLYKQALSARVQPVLSNVPSATALSLGRAYLCLSQADVGDFWADAEREFTTVIDAYNADHARGNESARDLASDAHSNLGFVSLPGRCAADRDQRYRKAAQEYQSAIDLSQLHRGRQGFYYEMLGYIDTQLGALDDARTAYRNAMRVDDANTDHYSQLLQDVQPPAPEQCP